MTTKTKAVEKARAAAVAARRTSMELTSAAWRAARVRGLDSNEAYQFVLSVGAGKITLDLKEIDRQVEAYIETVRLHESCKDYVRERGSASYDYRGAAPRLDAHLCEGCAEPLSCSRPSGKHEYRELSPAEARAKGRYHGGRCYHVYLCTGCGHVRAVDSSD